MKKSKAIAIGLLALSVASCTQSRNRQRLDDYQSNPNYYIDNGSGYNQGGVSPFWVYWAYGMGSYGRYTSYPVYVHQSYGRYGTYHVTTMGRSSRISGRSISSRGGISRGSVSRGGFGGAGHSSSAA